MLNKSKYILYLRFFKVSLMTALHSLGLSLNLLLEECFSNTLEGVPISGNSFKTVGKAFQVKLVKKLPRVCNAVIKAKGGYLKNLKYKIYLDLFNTFFGYFMIPYVLFHSFDDVFTIILQCRK